MKTNISFAVACLLFSTSNAINRKEYTNLQIPVPRSSEEFHASEKLSDAEKEDNMAKKDEKKTKGKKHLSQAKHGHSDEEDSSDDDNKFVPAELDNKGNPEFTWQSSHDHVGYSKEQIAQDEKAIDFKLTKKSIGQYCSQDDWLILRYKMWSQEDGTLLEDTDAKTEYHDPVVAIVGKYQLSKCLDIAVQKMKTGEEATVKCPNHLDLGGAVKNAWDGRYRANNSFFSKKIDTKYHLKVQECNRHPHYFEDADHVETLSAGYPFYFLSSHTDAHGNRMALTVDTKDLYAPRKTGVHNVKLAVWGGREHADTRQQWMWNAENNSLDSVGVPGTSLFEGFNKNIITYKWRGLHNQRFKYDIGTERFENRFTGNALDVVNDKI